MLEGNVQEGKNIQDFLIENSYKNKEDDIKCWWDNFSLFNEKIIKFFSPSYEGEFDLPKWMNENLQSIDKDITWEFRPGIKKKHGLVITSEIRRNLRLLVKKIVNSAPIMDEWDFFAYRLPESLDEISEMIIERTGWRCIEDIRFELSRNKLNRIDIIYYLPFLDTEKQSLDNLFLLSIFVLGEEIVDKWIGNIDVNFSDTDEILNDSLEKISKLNKSVFKEIKGIREKLPRSPYFLTLDDGCGWTMIEFSPKKQKDYFNRDDVSLCSVASIELFEAVQDRYFFDSIRFSRHNEIFVYLKISGEEGGLIGMNFPFIKEKLDQNLKSEGLGCIIGSAVGLKYLYIDLAIIDTYKSICKIVQLLRVCDVGEKSWMFFYDAELESKWIGVWDNSPEPLLRDKVSDIDLIP